MDGVQQRVAGATAMLDLLERRVTDFKTWVHKASLGTPPRQQPSEISEGEVNTLEALVEELALLVTGKAISDEAVWERSKPFCRKIERKQGEYWAQQDEYFRCFLLWLAKTRMYLTYLQAYSNRT